MNPEGKKSGGDTAFSVSDAIGEEMEKLLEVVEQEGRFGKRKQGSLKALCAYIRLGAISSPLSLYWAVI
jgi:hypothetical protein